MENKPIILKIKTLTPIWTGGVEEKMDRVHETGIIGSIRWWYEVVARGLGYYVCDPTSDKRCGLSGKEKDNNERISKLCPACYLFGTAGWKRMFNLQVVFNGKQPVEGNEPFCQATRSNKNWLSTIFEKSIKSKSRTFFGLLDLKFFPRYDQEQIEEQLRAILLIMSNLGSLGAKPQFGYGLFEFIDKKEDIKESLRKIHKFLKSKGFKKSNNDEGFFSLKNYWKMEFKGLNNIPPGNLEYLGSKKCDLYTPMSFDVRYDLRKKYLEKSESKEATANIFGGTKGNKWASKVFVSNFYKEKLQENKYKLRVWGFTEKDVTDVAREVIKGEYRPNVDPEIFTMDEMLKEVTKIDS